jgi:hypothetical protein
MPSPVALEYETYHLLEFHHWSCLQTLIHPTDNVSANVSSIQHCNSNIALERLNPLLTQARPLSPD